MHTNKMPMPFGWSTKKLDEIVDKKIVYGIVQAGPHQENGIPYIKSSDISDEIDSTKLQRTSLDLHKKYARSSVGPGDIVFSLRGNIAEKTIIPTNLAVANLTQGTARISVASEHSPDYVFYQLESPQMVRRILTVSKGSTFKEISLNELRKLSMPFPESRQEETKIASILKCWDFELRKLTRLIKQKQKQKMALMQRLLTGKKRFPEFKNQEWQESEIGRLLETVKRPVEWSDEVNYNLISVRRRSGGAFLRESLIGKDILTKKMNIALEGDFLISKMQVVHGAMTLTPPELCGMNVSDSYISLIARQSEQFDIKFFDWLSRLPELYHKAYRSSYGVHIEKMTFKLELFLKEKITYPTEITEQRKIVAVLEAAEKEIALLTQKLEAYQEQKKGLMQQLLTGKKRVNIQDGGAA